MDKTPPPIELENSSMNVHLSYIRRDLDELKSIQKSQHAENLAKLDSLHNSYVTRIDFEEHLKADEDHEKRIRGLEQEEWKRTGINTILGAGAGIIAAIVVKLIG